MAQEGKAYIHAALALYYAGAQINEDNLKKVIEALGLQADEAKVKLLVASLSQINIDEVLRSAAVPVAAPVAAPSQAQAAQPAAAQQAAGEKKEERKEEKKEASEAEISEGLASLFGF